MAFPDAKKIQDKRLALHLLFLVFHNLLTISKEYSGKIIGIVAHRAPQLALEAITKKISWEEAIRDDWRKTGDWKPGWEYYI